VRWTTPAGREYVVHPEPLLTPRRRPTDNPLPATPAPDEATPDEADPTTSAGHDPPTSAGHDPPTSVGLDPAADGTDRATADATPF
jgi:hypothetical protein